MIALQMGISFAKDYLERLQQIHSEIETINNDPQKLIEVGEKQWHDLTMFHRTLWIALIMEIGRLLDTEKRERKKVISFRTIPFFQNEPYKTAIDRIRGEVIVNKILHQRNTFTAHMAESMYEITSIETICKSNLNEILDQLDAILTQYLFWFTNNRQWESLGQQTAEK